jgi:hypothetical protein
MNRKPPASGMRVAGGAASLILLLLVTSGCAHTVVPDRTQLLGTWVNFETNAMLYLAEDGTCHVTGLPRGVEDGFGPPDGEPYSAGCTWQMRNHGEHGLPSLTISVVGDGDMTIIILDGPKLGVREGLGDRFFEFERALL